MPGGNAKIAYIAQRYSTSSSSSSLRTNTTREYISTTTSRSYYDTSLYSHTKSFLSYMNYEFSQLSKGLIYENNKTSGVTTTYSTYKSSYTTSFPQNIDSPNYQIDRIIKSGYSSISTSLSGLHNIRTTFSPYIGGNSDGYLYICDWNKNITITLQTYLAYMYYKGLYQTNATAKLYNISKTVYNTSYNTAKYFVSYSFDQEYDDYRLRTSVSYSYRSSSQRKTSKYTTVTNSSTITSSKSIITNNVNI